MTTHARVSGSKLALAETVTCASSDDAVACLASELKSEGWQVRQHQDRLAARRGVVGRVGPLLVHTGLVFLLIGAAWERSPVSVWNVFWHQVDLDLLDPAGANRLSLTLERFSITRDPAGRPEQFQSTLTLSPPGEGRRTPHDQRESSPSIPGHDGVSSRLVLGGNHGADRQESDAAAPPQHLSELGDQIWGLVLPTRPDGSEPVFLSTSSEQGPVQVFDSDGGLLTNLRPGGEGAEVRGLPLKVIDILPASGLLLKRDPGVPLVYAGFAITLLGGALSMIATRQIWVISDNEHQRLHIGGLCNRNLLGFAAELPQLISKLDVSHD